MTNLRNIMGGLTLDQTSPRETVNAARAVLMRPPRSGA